MLCVLVRNERVWHELTSYEQIERNARICDIWMPFFVWVSWKVGQVTTFKYIVWRESECETQYTMHFTSIALDHNGWTFLQLVAQLTNENYSSCVWYIRTLYMPYIHAVRMQIFRGAKQCTFQIPELNKANNCVHACTHRPQNARTFTQRPYIFAKMSDSRKR